MKQVPQSTFFVMTVVALLSAASPLNAETKVWGIISKDTKWTLDGSPYRVIGDILVKRNARLSIFPGVKILCSATSLKDTSIAQYDHLDSFSVAIKVEGCIECVGKKDKRIIFAPASGDAACSWYGIILNKASDQYTDIAFTDISGAFNGITAIDCSPLVRNCVVDRNNVGVNCLSKGNARVYNCVITENFTTGVKLLSANPTFFNNIIVFNKNNGLWCDGISRVTFQFNCVWGNADGNFLECDPELGVAVKGSGKIPVDENHNIISNPVFAGSEYDSAAVEKDLTLATDRSRIADTALARMLYKSLADSLAAKQRKGRYPRFWLSKYSPCINTGNPAREFKDLDGTRSDMGIYGGPEYLGK
jgi:Right handed beta helix region